MQRSQKMYTSRIFQAIYRAVSSRCMHLCWWILQALMLGDVARTYVGGCSTHLCWGMLHALMLEDVARTYSVGYCMYLFWGMLHLLMLGYVACTYAGGCFMKDFFPSGGNYLVTLEVKRDNRKCIDKVHLSDTLMQYRMYWLINNAPLLSE